MQVDLLKGNVGAKFREEMRSVQSDAETGGKGIGGALSGALGMAAVAAAGIGMAMVGAGVASLKSAADFQEAMTQLVTGAGESADNIALVSRGILDMAGQVGVSAQDLAAGMYMVESAGFHGAQGLSVLRAAAEGAKVGNADMATVANAVTSALNAYGLSGDHATEVTNALVSTVAAGKMHMQDLAGSLGTVLPEAASLKIGISDVSGAIATMTMQGTDAFTATQGLRFLMTSLVKTTPAAAKEMENFGLKSADVAKELTTRGLQATLQTITDAVGKKFPEGSAEYLQAVATMVGGTRGLNTVLELTGSHMATYKANIASISTGAKLGGKDVQGWAEVQRDFNFQMQAASAGAQAFGISIGTRLLPYATQLLAAFVAALPSLESFANQAVTVGVQIGTAMVPWIQRAGQVLGFLRQHGDEVKAALLGLAASFAAFKVITFIQGWMAVISAMRSLAATEGVMTAVNWLLGTSELFAYWPLLLIVAGIGLAVAAGYLLITHWKQISHWAMQIGLTIKDWVLKHLTLLTVAMLIVLGPVGLMVAAAILLITHWKQVATFLARLPGLLGGAFSWLGTQAHEMVGAVGGAFSALGSAVHGALMRVVSVAEQAWSEFSRRPFYWIGYLLTYIPVHLALLVAHLAVWAARMVARLVTWGVTMGVRGTEAMVAFGAHLIAEIQKLPGEIEDWLEQTRQRALDKLAQLVDQARQSATDARTAITTEVQRLPGEIWNWLEQTRQRAHDKLWELINEGRSAASNFGTALVQELQKLPGQMVAIGQAIVQGVIDGIKSMISSGVGAIGDFVHGLVQGAKDASKSSSPSRLFAEEVGQPIPEGIALGVSQRARVAQQQITDLIGALVPSRGAATAVGAAVGQAAAPASTATAGGEVHDRDAHEVLVEIRNCLRRVEILLMPRPGVTAPRAYGRSAASAT